MKSIFTLALLLLFTCQQPHTVQAQSTEQSESEVFLRSEAELDILIGPIALYPDPLIAILLPAATEPAEIVLAVRFLNRGGELEQIELQRWDDNVKALAYYPDVIRWMDENLEWTVQLGEAFLVQPQDVMETIQRLRRYAQELGNLYTTPQQIVEVDNDGIDILPADPDTLYVPIYPPHVPYTRQPIAGGAAYVSFDSGWRTGNWLRHDWDWRNRRVVQWNREQFRPRTWWSQPRAQRFTSSTTFREWCPRPRGGQFPSKWWATRHQLCKTGQPVTATSAAQVHQTATTSTTPRRSSASHSRPICTPGPRARSK